MSFRFDSAQGLIRVDTRIWGPAGDAVVSLALDTGATATVMDYGVLVTLGYDPALAPERVRITTGSGVEYAPRVSVRRIEALGQDRAPFDILAHTLPPSASVYGLLGLDFFRQRRLIIDFRDGRIELE